MRKYIICAIALFLAGCAGGTNDCGCICNEEQCICTCGDNCECVEHCNCHFCGNK